MARRRPKAKGKTSVPEVVASTPVSSDQAAPSCSFCGKNQRDVRKLIHGPGVCICDECVELCQEILAPPRRVRRTKREDKPPTKGSA